jgi:hypothetical protein
MTKLYFHNALTSDTGTLPTTIKSSLGTAFVSADAATVNRSMNSTIGTSQTSLALNNNSNATENLYFTRFVSNTLTINSLIADTWNYTFAAMAANAACNFPVTTVTASLALYVTLYVWRPSTGAKIATICDANSNATFGSTSTNVSTEKSFTGTFAGSAASFASQDILCFEVFMAISQSTLNSEADTYYYDGTTETNANGTTVTSQASHIESPNNTITTGHLNTRTISDRILTPVVVQTCP